MAEEEAQEEQEDWRFLRTHFLRGRKSEYVSLIQLTRVYPRTIQSTNNNNNIVRHKRRNKCRLYAPIIVHIVHILHCTRESGDEGLTHSPWGLTWLGNFNNLLLPTMLLLCAIDIIYYHFSTSSLVLFLATARSKEYPRLGGMETARVYGRDIKECREIGVCAWPMNNCWIFRIILVTLSASIIIIIISAGSTTHWQDDEGCTAVCNTTTTLHQLCR